MVTSFYKYPVSSPSFGKVRRGYVDDIEKCGRLSFLGRAFGID
jgi:hypothetical protein